MKSYIQEAMPAKGISVAADRILAGSVEEGKIHKTRIGKFQVSIAG